MYFAVLNIDFFLKHMSIEKELQMFLGELDKKIAELVGPKSEKEMIAILKNWEKYPKLENEIKQIFTMPYDSNLENLKKIHIKSFDEENTELIHSLCNLKEKIQKSIHPNIK